MTSLFALLSADNWTGTRKHPGTGFRSLPYVSDTFKGDQTHHARSPEGRLKVEAKTTSQSQWTFLIVLTSTSMRFTLIIKAKRAHVVGRVTEAAKVGRRIYIAHCANLHFADWRCFYAHTWKLLLSIVCDSFLCFTLLRLFIRGRIFWWKKLVWETKDSRIKGIMKNLT